MSTASPLLFPFDVQLPCLHTHRRLEKAEVMRPAYAIEYDYVKSGQLYLHLGNQTHRRLFLAGQINGTTGYEEAAGQGLIAGINAALKVAGQSSFYPQALRSLYRRHDRRSDPEDLTEPYRMFTSRAEHRLLFGKTMPICVCAVMDMSWD